MRKGGNDGIRVPGEPFNFKLVARFLSTHKKWNRTLTGGKYQVKDKTGVVITYADPQLENRNGQCRPVGINLRKQRGRDLVEKLKVRREMRIMKTHLGIANNIFTSAARRDRRTFLLAVLPG